MATNSASFNDFTTPTGNNEKNHGDNDNEAENSGKQNDDKKSKTSSGSSTISTATRARLAEEKALRAIEVIERESELNKKARSIRRQREVQDEELCRIEEE